MNQIHAASLEVKRSLTFYHYRNTILRIQTIVRILFHCFKFVLQHLVRQYLYAQRLHNYVNTSCNYHGITSSHLAPGSGANSTCTCITTVGCTGMHGDYSIIVEWPLVSVCLIICQSATIEATSDRDCFFVYSTEQPVCSLFQH